LLDETVEQYLAVVELDEMTDGKAMEELTALVLGMLTLEIQS